MLSKKSFGIAGAAMLGAVALLGTNAANAVINLDDADADAATVTFAQETVDDTVEGTDGRMYYVVNGAASELDVAAEVQLAGAQDTTFIVTYMLTDMVFNVDLEDESIALSESNGTAKATGAGSRVLRSGGEMGDDTAEFEISAQETTFSRDDVLTLTVGSFGVRMGGGTVSVTIKDKVDGRQEESETGMVKLATGVKETSNAVNANTFVARNYTDFGLDSMQPPMPVYMDDVGSFMVESQHLDASDGTAATLNDVYGDAFDEDRPTALENATITFDDMWFGFAESAWLDDATCGNSSGPAVWGPEDAEDDDSENEIKPLALTDLGGDSNTTMTGMRYLCLMAPDDGTGSIPRTTPFTAMTMYKGVTDAKIPPMDGMITLGMIIRDGITVHLPYLTTSARYVQRLVLVNRNENDVAYTIEFANEGETTTDPMTYSGMAAGTGDDDDAPNAMISTMKISDIVEIMGTPPRTAGTVNLESVPDMVDVATTQINMETSATDTIVYEAK
jgi:hypothetical protein